MATARKPDAPLRGFDSARIVDPTTFDDAAPESAVAVSRPARDARGDAAPASEGAGASRTSAEIDPRKRSIVELLKATYDAWDEDNALRLAAALSYYTAFAAAPLLVLIIALAGVLLGNHEASDQVLARVGAVMGPQGAEFFRSMITETQQPKASIVATIIGVVTLVVGATGVFAELQNSLNLIWKVEAKKTQGVVNFVRVRALSFLMLAVLGGLLVASLLASAAIGYVNQLLHVEAPAWLVRLTQMGLSFASSVVLFGSIYKILPDRRIAWRDVGMGSLATATLFTVGRLLIGLYLSKSGLSSSYGAAGSLAVMLAWVYYSSLVFFFGAEFTKVYTAMYGSDAKTGAKLVPELAAPANERR